MYIHHLQTVYINSSPGVHSASGPLPLLPLEGLQSRDAAPVPCPDSGQQVGMRLGAIGKTMGKP